MSVEEMYAIYASMKESGDLMTLFPDMSGEWEADQKKFTRQYNSNEMLLDETFIDLDDDELDIY